MFTEVRDPSPRESFGLQEEQDTDDTTVIEIYLEDNDLETVKENGLLAIPDPTVGHALIAAHDYDTKIVRDGGVSATPRFEDSQVRRMKRGKTPITYATAHVDGAGDSTRGTVLEFYHASEY